MTLSAYELQTDGTKFKTVPYATLATETAALNPDVLIRCPDYPGGAALLLSDGVRWRVFGRGAQAARIPIAGGAGTADFIYDTPFTVTPVVVSEIIDPTGVSYGKFVLVSSATEYKVQFKQQLGVLPGLLTSLLGASLFPTNAADGLMVNILAFNPTRTP